MQPGYGPGPVAPGYPPQGGPPQGGPPQGGPPGYGAPGYGAPPGYGQAAPPPKKGMSGCLLAFLIVGGLFLVSMIGGGIWFYSQFSGFVGATGDMAKLMVEAQNAPGTKEMKSAGCTEAFALDMKKMAKAIQRFEDEMAKREKRTPKDMTADIGKDGGSNMLVCKKTFGTAPTCEKVAKAFIDKVHPDGSITVTVESGNVAKCTERFDKDGTSLGAGKKVDIPTAQ